MARRFNENVQFDNGIKIPASAANGKVFVSDASGNGTWQSVSGWSTATSLVVASGSLTCTTSLQSIPGLSFTVSATGTYLINGVIDFSATATGYTAGVGVLVQNTTQQSNQIVFGDNGTASQRSTCGQNWILACTSSDTLVLKALKAGAGGTIATATTNCTLAISRVG